MRSLLAIGVLSCCCCVGRPASDRRIDLMGTFFKWMSVGNFGGVPATFTRDEARKAGYHSDTHPLVTDDGYLVRLTSIQGRGPVRKRPVLVMHGLASSSDHWIIRGPQKDLPYILADLGHDVWIGDWRGNYFASKHRSLSTSDPAFWKFSFYDRALHDLPVMIDYILLGSNFSQIFYVGYSFGTSALMVLTSMAPEYNDKVKMGFLLAPIGYPIKDFVHPAIEMAAENIVGTHNQTDLSVVYDFFPRYSVVVSILRFTCKYVPDSCWELNYLLFGLTKQNVDEATFQAFLDRAPSGASSLDVIYLMQIYLHGFRGYDYGERYNLEVYGKRSPPEVPVENISVPLALFYSPTDHLNSEEGVISLANRLKSVVVLRKIGIPNFSHLDFMFGTNVEKVLYPEIVRVMGAAESGSLPPPRRPQYLSAPKKRARNAVESSRERIFQQIEPVLQTLRKFWTIPSDQAKPPPNVMASFNKNAT